MQTKGFSLGSSFIHTSFEQIVESYIKALEYEIFPKLFERIHLPNLPSRAEVKRYELKRPRISKLSEKKYEDRHPLKKTALIQEIAYLKNQLNGHHANKASDLIKEYFLGGNEVLFEEQHHHPNIYEEILEKKADFLNLFDLIKISKSTIDIEKEKDSIRSKFESKAKINFSDDIINKLLSDSIFLKFINQIEISLHNYRNINGIDFEGNIFMERDFEIANLNKTILSLDVVNLSIEEKLDLWDTLDNFLRFEINKSITYASKTEKIKLLKFSNSFFTNIELY